MIIRHPGEGRDLTVSSQCTGEIPAFAGMTEESEADMTGEQLTAAAE